jgi:hypothetical protein
MDKIQKIVDFVVCSGKKWVITDIGIGKQLSMDDPYYKGKMAQFKSFDEAVTHARIIAKKYNGKVITDNKDIPKDFHDAKKLFVVHTFNPPRFASDSFAKIIKGHEKEIKEFLKDQDSELSDDLFMNLAQHYEMPYGTMKARTGDPWNFLYEKLSKELQFKHLGSVKD